MEVIVDELRKNNVNIDAATLLRHINYVFDGHEGMYNVMVARINPDELLDVFHKINVNNFGRAVAHLTLVYLMNIPEDAKREAVRLVATIFRNVDVTRVEEGFFRRMFSWIKTRKKGVWRMRNRTDFGAKHCCEVSLHK